MQITRSSAGTQEGASDRFTGDVSQSLAALCRPARAWAVTAPGSVPWMLVRTTLASCHCGAGARIIASLSGAAESCQGRTNRARRSAGLMGTAARFGGGS